eukprot:746621-Hanusia_phi.AAC.2
MPPGFSSLSTWAPVHSGSAFIWNISVMMPPGIKCAGLAERIGFLLLMVLHDYCCFGLYLFESVCRRCQEVVGTCAAHVAVQRMIFLVFIRDM